MADDLGAGEGEVHAQAAQVLRFWFEEVRPEQQFAKDDALDRTIAARFGTLRDQVFATRAAAWRSDPDDLLAAVILLDQFSRNIHRASPEAYAADPLALELTRLALRNGWDETLPPERTAFLYLPLMHSESLESQELSVQCYERLGLEENIRFARDHRDVIARFGRFPSRNAALGRASTPAEEAYLSQPDAGW